MTSLYIHIPWCVRKCPYCDFNSHQQKEAALPEDTYIDALIRDLHSSLRGSAFATEAIHFKEIPISTIFFGGGTPSLFSPEGIDRILTEVKNRIPFAPDIEITLEANPGTVDYDKFAGFYSVGINRLSIGIQSFQPDKLLSLGRIHDGSSAMRAIEAAQKAGFTNFNIDLMHGLPNQTVEDALYDLKTALTFEPPHLSWYQLTLEPNTLFYKQPPPLPPDDHLADIQEQGQKLLAEAGFQNYEISAYCKPGRACKHNLNYWKFGDYLGIGAGAHAKIANMRYWKTRHPKEYMTSAFLAGQQEITPDELPFEFMLNVLRLHQPISFELFESRTGLSREILLKPFATAQNKGLLTFNDHTFQPTPLGYRFLNDLTSLFLPC